MASNVQPPAPIGSLQKKFKPPKEPKPLKAKPGYKMKQVGKYGKKSLATRKEWIKRFPPDHAGYYVCGICGGPVAAKGMELDHIKQRSTNPELRFELDNLRPTHAACNRGRE